MTGVHRLEAVHCRNCGHAYDRHGIGGGRCGGADGPHTPGACDCPGFRWVAADGPPVGSYTDPPQRPS